MGEALDVGGVDDAVFAGGPVVAGENHWDDGAVFDDHAHGLCEVGGAFGGIEFGDAVEINLVEREVALIHLAHRCLASGLLECYTLK